MSDIKYEIYSDDDLIWEESETDELVLIPENGGDPLPKLSAENYVEIQFSNFQSYLLTNNQDTLPKTQYFEAILNDFFQPLYQKVAECMEKNDSSRKEVLEEVICELEGSISENRDKTIPEIHMELKKTLNNEMQKPEVQKLDLTKVLRRALGVLVCMSVVGNLAWLFKAPRKTFWQTTEVSKTLDNAFEKYEDKAEKSGILASPRFSLNSDPNQR